MINYNMIITNIINNDSNEVTNKDNFLLKTMAYDGRLILNEKCLTSKMCR